jgi:hypothetical protein
VSCLGYTPNYNRLFAPRPNVYAAWKQLNGAIRQEMDRPAPLRSGDGRCRRSAAFELLRLAHGKVLLERFGIKPGDPLDDEDRAVQQLARKVTDDAVTVTGADLDRLRAFGLSDDEIFDVVLAAAARCFFSKTLDALGVQPDAAYRGLDAGVREALVVGRPTED